MRDTNERQVKVPEPTAGFWTTKLLTTAFGEAASDWLGGHGDPAINGALVFGLLAVATVLQFAARRYSPWRYWSLAALIAVFGTMVADVLHVVLGVPYWASSAGFATLLAIVLAVWFASERTLDIHTVRTTRREVFYWLTVGATFALGTALGDLTAGKLHLGYLGSVLAFGIVILIPVAGRRWWRFGEVFAFWFAYIVTRPLGASVADWADVRRIHGGLGLGTGPVSLLLGAAMVVAFAWLTLRLRRADQISASSGARPLPAPRAETPAP